jgi:hypothetical protein
VQLKSFGTSTSVPSIGIVKGFHSLWLIPNISLRG